MSKSIALTPLVVATLLLAACAAFSGADTIPDGDGDGAAPTDADSSVESDGAQAASDDGAADSGQARDGATDGGDGYGNDAPGFVRCGDSLPSCGTAPAGPPFTLCCAPSTGAPVCIERDAPFCSQPVTIRCDGPEDCGDQPRCRNKEGLDPRRIEFSCWESTDVLLSACHDDSDCGGSDLKCRRLTCGAVVLGVCASNVTVWPDASPCSLD